MEKPSAAPPTPAFGWALAPRSNIPNNAYLDRLTVDGGNIGPRDHKQQPVGLSWDAFPGYANLERPGRDSRDRYDQAYHGVHTIGWTRGGRGGERGRPRLRSSR